MSAKSLIVMFKDTAYDWLEDKAARLGAALAFYTVFALAPLLVITIAVAGFVFGREAAQGQIVGQVQDLVGKEGGEVIQTMVQSASQRQGGVLATVLGVIMLLVGAMGLFGQLQDALNTIWGVQPKPGRGILGFLRDRFLSFAMVLTCAFLLLVSLVVSAGLAALTQFIGVANGVIGHIINEVLSVAVITVLFAMIYRMLPDAKIAWSDVWLGAAITAVLFEVGKFLIGLYLGHAGIGSAYGAAGSLAVLLIWLYYSAQIFLFGAEFTKVYADKYGSRIVPAENAVPVTEQARCEQGIPHDHQRVSA